MSLIAAYVGASGAILILVAFVLSSLDKISRNSYRYMAINGSGAAMLIYYALDSNAIVFVVLNVIWLGIEIYYLIRKLMKK